MHNKKVILFDFFGVLSSFVYTEIIKKYTPKNEEKIWLKRLSELNLELLSEKNFVDLISKKANISSAIIYSNITNKATINTQLLKFIEKDLKKIFSIGLFTNINRNLLERLLGDNIKLFDIQIVSSDVKLEKPDIKIFNYAIQKTKHNPEEIIFIDDNQINIDVADQFKITGILYQDFESLRKKLREFY